MIRQKGFGVLVYEGSEMWVLQICCNGFVQSERGEEWGSANELRLVMR